MHMREGVWRNRVTKELVIVFLKDKHYHYAPWGDETVSPDTSATVTEPWKAKFEWVGYPDELNQWGTSRL